MSKRPLCKSRHNWQPARVGQKCTNCPDVFPCRYQCAHVDCQDERGAPSRCAVCRQPVPFEEQFRFGSKRNYVAHNKVCRDRAKEKDGPDQA